MIRISVVCEGDTEEKFINMVMRPEFLSLGIRLEPVRINTSPGHSGGALTYDRLKLNLRNLLRDGKIAAVTTLIDLYKLDTGFPDFEVARRNRDLGARLDVLFRAFHADIVSLAGCRADRFIPYIQPYEFEALLFADVESIIAHDLQWQSAAEPLMHVRSGAETPEHINDRPETKPAAHLTRHLRNPGFRKALHGPQIAANIGLYRIEAECPFFADWVRRLRGMAPDT